MVQIVKQETLGDLSFQNFFLKLLYVNLHRFTFKTTFTPLMPSLKNKMIPVQYLYV